MPTIRALLRDARVIALSRWKAIAAIVLVVWVPLTLLLEAHPAARGDSLKDVAIYLRLYRSMNILLGVFATMAIAYLTQEFKAGRQPTVRDCFSEVAHRWGASVWMHCLQGFILVLSLLALVLPFFYAACLTYFALYEVALRDKNGRDALKASYRLVKGRWWGTFRLLAILLVIELCALVIVSAPFAILPEGYLVGVVAAVVFELTAAFFIIADVSLFLHLEACQSQPNEGHQAPPLIQPV